MSLQFNAEYKELNQQASQGLINAIIVISTGTMSLVLGQDRKNFREEVAESGAESRATPGFTSYHHRLLLNSLRENE